MWNFFYQQWLALQFALTKVRLESFRGLVKTLYRVMAGNANTDAKPLSPRGLQM